MARQGRPARGGPHRRLGHVPAFDPENWEILVKVLDGCRTNGRFWVLGASTTNLGYRVQVTDTVTGDSRSYENEPGQSAPAIVDTDAFSPPCGGGSGGH